MLFDGDLAATPGTVKAIVDLDSGARTKLSLIDTIIPVAAGIAGVVALAAGIFLRVRKRRQDQPRPAERSRHLAAG